MPQALPHIPCKVYIAALGRTFDLHWNYHALLMVFVWIILVPLCITIMRFHKPPPSEKGIQRDVKLRHPEWWFFSLHKFGLIFAMILAFGGGAFALVASGLSGSIHSCFGVVTLVLGAGQLISSQFRGTRGGKYRDGSDPNNPATWQGDQYSRTPKRRIFEAIHKTCGYFTMLFAFGAVGSGFMQYDMPVLLTVFLGVSFAWCSAWVIYAFKERAYDGYRVAHGYGLEHPYNKKREYL